VRTSQERENLAHRQKERAVHRKQQKLIGDNRLILKGSKRAKGKVWIAHRAIRERKRPRRMTGWDRTPTQGSEIKKKGFG